MFRFDLKYSQTLPPGYTVKGSVNIPGNTKHYILLDFGFIWFSRKLAWTLY